MVTKGWWIAKLSLFLIVTEWRINASISWFITGSDSGLLPNISEPLIWKCSLEYGINIASNVLICFEKVLLGCKQCHGTPARSCTKQNQYALWPKWVNKHLYRTNTNKWQYQQRVVGQSGVPIDVPENYGHCCRHKTIMSSINDIE